MSFTGQEVQAATGGALKRGADRRCTGISTDTRTLKAGDLFVPIIGENYDGHDFVDKAMAAGACGCLGQRELDIDGVMVVVEDTLEALGDLAANHLSQLDSTIVGITGSNGKTTTKDMVATMLAAYGPVHSNPGNFNNLVGLPLTAFDVRSHHEYVVLEMGMNRPGEIARLTEIARPKVGVITSVAAAHLEGLLSIEGVMWAKGELFVGLDEDAVAVVNATDKHVVRAAEGISARTVTVGVGADKDVSVEGSRRTGVAGLKAEVTVRGTGRYELRLRTMARHDVWNAAMAIGVLVALELDPGPGIQALIEHSGRQNRLAWKVTPSGINVIDDTYNANPASVRAALQTLSEVAGQRRKIAVLGDMLEMGDESPRHHSEIGIRRGHGDRGRQRGAGVRLGRRRGACGRLGPGEGQSRDEDGARRAGADGGTIRVSAATAGAADVIPTSSVTRTSTSSTVVNLERPWDPWILLPTFLLLGLGIVMVYSASVGVADMRFDDPTRFLRGHLKHVAVGFVALIAGMALNYQTHRKLVYWILAISSLLLLATALGFGITRGRSTRWLNLVVFELQPSEVAKLAFVIYMAYSLEKKLKRIEEFWIGWVPHLLVAALLMGLCIIQPDLGTCLVLAGVLLTMLWVAGSRAVYAFGLFTVFLPLFAFYVFGSSGRYKRIMAWLDPWEDRYGAGFQVANSLTSLASGGLGGLGLGAGRQKMGFLTQGWTDFMFSSIGEELGLVGTLVVALLFGLLIFRGLRASRRAPDYFGRFLAFGLTVLIGGQAVFNMAVSVGMVPTKGLNLPLVSGGGSSLVMSMLAIGILLNVSRYAESPGAFQRDDGTKKRKKPKKPKAQKKKAAAKKKPRKPITQRESGVRPFVPPKGAA